MSRKTEEDLSNNTALTETGRRRVRIAGQGAVVYSRVMKCCQHASTDRWGTDVTWQEGGAITACAESMNRAEEMRPHNICS